MFKLVAIFLVSMTHYVSSSLLLKESPINLQTGNLCVTSDDCYPVNWFNNVCCVKYGSPGQCCNMFSYISLNPVENFKKLFLEGEYNEFRHVNAVILWTLIVLMLMFLILLLCLMIKFSIWLCSVSCSKKQVNYFVTRETSDTTRLNPKNDGEDSVIVTA